MTTCVAAILVAAALGLYPDERQTLSESRKEICQSVASSIAFDVESGNYDIPARHLNWLARKREDLISAGLRHSSGELVAATQTHAETWQDDFTNNADGCYIVPINLHGERWAEAEFRFKPVYVGFSQFFSVNLLKMLGIVGPFMAIMAFMQLRQIFQYLDPSKAVPPRVRQTLDSFSEGVVLLDEDDRIVLTNSSFASQLRQSNSDLVGRILWEQRLRIAPEDRERIAQLEKKLGALRGLRMELLSEDGEVESVFSVNVTAVTDDADNFHGLMSVFTDVTPLEMNRIELEDSLAKLKESKSEISKQNEVLRYYATRDPLTSCMNRRTFFEAFETCWNEAKSKQTPLSVIMLDVDHFKSVNDTHGHAAGDLVLRGVGEALQALTDDESDVVCRYGGEEFSILMPGASVEEACGLANYVREHIESMVFENFQVTASFGVSELSFGAADSHELLEQADKSLYVAKRGGRNRVERYDLLPEESTESSEEAPEAVPTEKTIPFPAVSALCSALTYRDPQTGMHSQRVSRYAALLAQQSLGPREVYTIEIAALLHDLGKIGVPDSILLKPDRLTEQEWEVMEKHDRIGVEIVSQAFQNKRLTEIIELHHTRYDGQGNPDGLYGDALPIGARILTLVDAFDAIVSDRPYRKGRSIEEAKVELRRCAGEQFDPHLVEQFIEMIESGSIESELQDAQSEIPHEMAICIGGQLESLIEAAQAGNAKHFQSLLHRLCDFAKKSNVASIVEATQKTAQQTSEATQLNDLLDNAFELVAACRDVRAVSLRLDDEIDDADNKLMQKDKQHETLAQPAGS